MPLNPSNPNLSISAYGREHRHDEVTTPEFAEALGQAASKLGDGFKVIRLADPLEHTVHRHVAILEPRGRTIEGVLEPDEAHIAIVSSGDTGPLYKEAEQIMAAQRQQES